MPPRRIPRRQPRRQPMGSGRKPNVKDVLNKYGSKLEGQVNSYNRGNRNYSSEYSTFKKEASPELTRYEKWCKSIGNFIKLNISEKDKKKFEKQLADAHVDVEPWQAMGLSVMSFLVLFILGLFISIAVVLINDMQISAFPGLFFFLMIIAGFFLFYFMNSYPARLANKWRLKASSQMVPALLYVVVYMRHTPNLERAMQFASDNLQPPLALDFKKVFYNVEMGKFSTIKESLDSYLEKWRDYSPEFIEGFHLIQSSLFEPNESRRIATLEKALQVVLDGVHEKMMKFSREVKSPLTNVYMLTIMLPVLGIALLPLASAMLEGLIKSAHVFVIYNLIIPFMAFFLIDKILMSRPGGYGQSKLLERNPHYAKYKSKEHYYKAFLVSFPFIILGLLPLLFQIAPLSEALGLSQNFTFEDIGLSFIGGKESFFGFVETETGVKGPFGLGALLLGMFLPLGIAIFFSVAYKSKTKELIKSRNSTIQLEQEFNNSLFQLGNRLGNGVPPELVFAKVAQSTKGLKTGEFFSKVNYNIRSLGMSVEKAIFGKKRGALNYYPSDLVATSMKILVEGSKKGLKIAARSLMSISQYMKNIDKITNRLKDLLAETVSSMKSNMTFLAPLLSGIVIGLSSMIVSILRKLELANQVGGAQEVMGGGMGNMLQLFQVKDMIPPYYLQIAIGLYLIEIIFILTSTLVTLDSGQDRLQQTNKTGINLRKGIFLYVVVASLATLALYALASNVLGNLGGT